MKQVEIIEHANNFRVNEWLTKNADKNIIDIKQSASDHNVVVMIIYEK